MVQRVQQVDLVVREELPQSPKGALAMAASPRAARTWAGRPQMRGGRKDGGEAGTLRHMSLSSSGVPTVRSLMTARYCWVRQPLGDGGRIS